MFSDSVLAINRFVQPLPWAAIWVLSSYYIAQALIVAGCLMSYLNAREKIQPAHTASAILANAPAS